ncbi:MAG: chitin synthase [Oscillospiraceae bacterium]|nr:chitin synthase [Oscillospiraceae bacterium]
MPRWISFRVLLGILVAFHVIMSGLAWVRGDAWPVPVIYAVLTSLYLLVWVLVLWYSVDRKSKKMLAVYFLFWLLLPVFLAVPPFGPLAMLFAPLYGVLAVPASHHWIYIFRMFIYIPLFMIVLGVMAYCKMKIGKEG